MGSKFVENVSQGVPLPGPNIALNSTDYNLYININGHIVNMTEYSVTRIQIMKVLEKNGALSRKQIQEILKIPRSTVYENLMKLCEDGLVQIVQRYTSDQGRPPLAFSLRTLPEGEKKEDN